MRGYQHHMADVSSMRKTGNPDSLHRGSAGCRQKGGPKATWRLKVAEDTHLYGLYED